MWIEDLPNGKFKYNERYFDDRTGTTKKVSTTLTAKTPQAKKKALQILNKKIDDKSASQTSGKRYGETLEEFLKYYQHTVMESTYIRAKQNFKLLEPKIDPNTLIEKMDSLYIENILQNLHMVDNYSKSVIKQTKSNLTVYFDFCRKEKYCTVNPMHEINVKFKPEKISPMTDNYLTQAELKRLIDYMRTKHKRYADMTELFAMTGLRYGELVNLKVTDVRENAIVISDSKTATGIRSVSLTDRCMDIINEMIYENNLLQLDTGYLCVSDKGNQILNPNYNRYLNRSAKEIGLTKSVTAHKLRHSHITLLATLGVDIKTIMHRVGHAKPEVTLKVYTHVTNEMNQTAVEKLNQLDI